MDLLGLTVGLGVLRLQNLPAPGLLDGLLALANEGARAASPGVGGSGATRSPRRPWHGVSMGGFHVGGQGYEPSLQGAVWSGTAKRAAELDGVGWSQAGAAVPSWGRGAGMAHGSQPGGDGSQRTHTALVLQGGCPGWGSPGVVAVPMWGAATPGLQVGDQQRPWFTL